MEYPHLGEQDDRDTAAFTLENFRPQFLEQRFDILPRNVGAGRVSVNGFQRAAAFPLHASMVLRNGTSVPSYSRTFPRPAFTSARWLLPSSRRCFEP